VAKGGVKSDNGRTELFVRSELLAGDAVDLRSWPEDRRVLSPEFLQDLLEDQTFDRRANRIGINIQGAIFKVPVDINTDFSSTLALIDCEFKDRVDFSGSKIGGGLSFDGSVFQNIAAFRDMTIGNDLEFDGALFERAVDFTRTMVNGAFSLDSARFMDPGHHQGLADFDSIVVKGAVTMNPFHSERLVSMPGIQIRDFIVSGLGVSNLDLSGGSIIQNEMDLNLSGYKGGNAFGDISVEGIKVNGTGYIHNGVNSAFPASINLRGASFGTLTLDLFQVPLNSNVTLDGISYRALTGKPDAGVWEGLSSLMQTRSKYTAEPYIQLEDFLRKHGFDDPADDLLTIQKRLERRSMSLLSLNFWWSLTDDLLVRYGSRPFRPIIICIVFVLFGSMVFGSRSRMYPREEKDANRYFSPFWYSLDLFFPVIDLQFKNLWAPRQDWRFGRIYAQVHRVLGWVLTGLALATIHGGLH
jgi:hypothetical protein